MSKNVILLLCLLFVLMSYYLFLCLIICSYVLMSKINMFVCYYVFNCYFVFYCSYVYKCYSVIMSLKCYFVYGELL